VRGIKPAQTEYDAVKPLHIPAHLLHRQRKKGGQSLVGRCPKVIYS